MINKKFWQGKKVFLTGHTGFKGTWLSLWLASMGAEVTGYALTPSTDPNLYHLCRLDEMLHSIIGDIRDRKKLVISIRNPYSIRPWQHVLEPLKGYLMLASKLVTEGSAYSGAWNFGSDEADCKPVRWIVQRISEKWEGEVSYLVKDDPSAVHEATFLKLDSSKAKSELGWRQTWDLDQSLDRIVEWTKAYEKKENMRLFSLQQIHDYISGGDHYNKL